MESEQGLVQLPGFMKLPINLNPLRPYLLLSEVFAGDDQRPSIVYLNSRSVDILLSPPLYDFTSSSYVNLSTTSVVGVSNDFSQQQMINVSLYRDWLNFSSSQIRGQIFGYLNNSVSRKMPYALS